MGWRKMSKGFRITLPDGWEDRSVYTFMGPEESGQTPLINVLVDDEPGEDDIADYGPLQAAALRETLPDAEILLEQKRTLKNGSEVYEVVLNWAPVDGQVIFIKNLYVFLKGRAFTFSGRFSKQGYKAMGRLVDTICETFEPI